MKYDHNEEQQIAPKGLKRKNGYKDFDDVYNDILDDEEISVDNKFKDRTSNKIKF